MTASAEDIAVLEVGLAIALLVATMLIAALVRQMRRDPVIQVQVPSQAPAPPPAPVEPPKAATPPRLQIQLVSASGRPLGTATIDARARRPLLRWRTQTDNCISVFVADRQNPNGQWIYRRVGVERE